MDFFGIGASIKGAANIYFKSSRATGRTTTLLESVKHGDRVVFINNKDLISFKKRLREMKIEEVDCIIVPTNDLNRLFDKGTSVGRTIFDHRWLEHYYLDAINDCQKVIDSLQTETSGYGEAHYKTRRSAIELKKWSHPY